MTIAMIDVGNLLDAFRVLEPDYDDRGPIASSLLTDECGKKFRVVLMTPAMFEKITADMTHDPRSTEE